MQLDQVSMLDGHSRQVRSLAHILIGFALGHKLTAKMVEAINCLSAIGKKHVPLAMLYSMPGGLTACAIHTFDPDGEEMIIVS